MASLFSFISSWEKFQVTSDASVFKGRVQSVDALRGFDMFWIIGGEYIIRSLDQASHSPVTGFLSTQVEHVEWFGFRFYDLIMPLFLFIVGVAMPFSFRRRMEQGMKKSSLWPHILKRVLVLWIFGMMVQGNLLHFDWQQIRFYSNTLQAIAAGYLIASVFILYLKVRWQVAGMLVLLLIYWTFLSLFPVPGVGKGVITPEGNAAIYLDKLLMGRFQDGTTYSWIISSLNFGATTLLGVFTGYILQSNKSALRKLTRLIIFGLLCILLALAWAPLHPIVKHIWTGSFVFFAAGLSILLLAFFFLITDVFEIRSPGKFFIVIGSNAIFAYMASHLFDWGLMADSLTGGLKQYTGDWYWLIRTTGGFSILWFILWQMNRHKIFLKI